ncbi:TPA: uridine kinase, partial [Legionella pneumophila subsp. pneumophila]|nr:uridine kinase [Legionella pneumophila subsp. pneumophila]
NSWLPQQNMTTTEKLPLIADNNLIKLNEFLSSTESHFLYKTYS